eukprot:Gb_22242 [translate_table: standard]
MVGGFIGVVGVVTNVIESSSASASVLLAIGMLRKLCNHPKLVANHLSEATGLVLPSENISNHVKKSGHIDVKGACQKQQLQLKLEPGESNLSGKLQCLDSLLSAVFEMCSGSKDRVVIVSNFTQTLDLIQGLCDSRCWKWLRLDGTTDGSSRQQVVDQFNSGFGNELIFLLSSKAGGTGLNLIGANRNDHNESRVQDLEKASSSQECPVLKICWKAVKEELVSDEVFLHGRENWWIQ